MRVTIRPVDLIVDRGLLTDLLSRNLGPSAAGPRFEWLYFGNPHGSAQAWVAIEESTGHVTGAAAAFPRKLSVGGTRQVGYVLGDFCIDQQYRCLGLAAKLQRACLEHIGAMPSISYDFPSDPMMAVYRRLQINPIGQLMRWSKPLRAERTMGKLVGSGRLATTVAAPINRLLKWKDGVSLSNCGWSVAEHCDECGEEFTELTRTVGWRYTCVERSAEYLNWRYRKHPLVQYKFLTARRGRDLLGYLVFSENGGDARIVDLFGSAETEMWTALVSRVVMLLHARGIATVSIPALGTNPWAGQLRKWGFHQREGRPVVVCASGKMATSSNDPGYDWFLTDGDRES